MEYDRVVQVNVVSSVRIRIESRDQLGELAGSFNRMSEALGTTISELSRTNQALEHVVGHVRFLHGALGAPALRRERSPLAALRQHRSGAHEE